MQTDHTVPRWGILDFLAKRALGWKDGQGRPARLSGIRTSDLPIPELVEDDRRTIREFARGAEALRPQALHAYRLARRRGLACNGDPEMEFMREVDDLMPNHDGIERARRRLVDAPSLGNSRVGK